MKTLYERNGGRFGAVFICVLTACGALGMYAAGVGWWTLAAPAVAIYAYLTPPTRGRDDS